MTPEAQRIAIAEACGWKQFKSVSVGSNDSNTAIMGTTPDSNWVKPIPDYLNDLNAMHEAETKCLDTDSMNPISFCPYADQLQDVCYDKTHWWCATAAQRAEAFLKTLGLWKE